MSDDIDDLEDLIDLCDEPRRNWPAIVFLLFWWLV